MKKITKYEILREFGSGPHGPLYEANDSFGERRVAIKAITADAPQRGDLIEGARRASCLVHPYIARVYDAVTDEQTIYVVRELVDGSPLEANCVAENLLPPSKVLETMYRCAQALDYAGRQQVMHRAIKPSNMILTQSGEVKITDFGAVHGGHTNDGAAAAAIYDFGVMLYRLLTGARPFKPGADSNDELLAPSQLRQDIPFRVDAVVKRALNKDATQRQQSWQEMTDDLAAALASVRGPKDVQFDCEKYHSLRSLPFFKSFPDTELWAVLAVARWHKYGPGQVLIREGEVGESFFLLYAGEVQIFQQGRLLNVLRGSGCFGEMAYLGNQQFHRIASVISSTDISVIEIKAAALDGASELCRHYFKAAFLAILIDRLTSANMRLSQLLADKNISIF